MATNFDLDDLIAFRTVAELGSFRRAAEAVHISQPAFSRRIDKLERTLGVRLLDRTTRRVSLTTVGREFARTTEQLLDDLDRALLGMQGVADSRAGEVKIACVPSTVYYFLTRVIKKYHEDYPQIRVHILDAGANAVLASVIGGEAEFGLNFIGAQDAELDFRLLHEERFVAALPKTHPLARRRQVTWSDLAKWDYISVDKSSGNRLLLDQALAGAKERPRSVYEAQHVTTLLGLVEAGLGVAVVPSLAMPGPSHPLLASVPITEPVVTRRVGLIRRKGRVLSPAAQALYDCFAAIKPVRARRGKNGLHP